MKTRTSLAYGHPFEAVGADKPARLHWLVSAWCRDHELRRPLRRIDVIAVLDEGTRGPAVEHLKGVGWVALGRQFGKKGGRMILQSEVATELRARFVQAARACSGGVGAPGPDRVHAVL